MRGKSPPLKNLFIVISTNLKIKIYFGTPIGGLKSPTFGVKSLKTIKHFLKNHIKKTTELTLVFFLPKEVPNSAHNLCV